MKIVFLSIDASGSMSSRTDVTLNGISEYIDSLKKSGDNIRLKLVFWNSLGYKIVFNEDVLLFDDSVLKQYKTKGLTPLLDVFGNALYELSKSNYQKRLLVVFTDGLENTSFRYTQNQVKEMMKEFLANENNRVEFFGADIDVWGFANDIGIPRQHTISYETRDTMQTYSDLSRSTRSFFDDGNKD